MFALCVLLGAVAISQTFAPAHAKSLEFYSTSAQVIPVTLLVLVVEARFFGALEVPVEDRTDVWTFRLITGVLLLVMVGGEFACLQALDANDPRGADARQVWMAHAVGFTAIVLSVFVRPRREGRGQ